jgi:hypothetical protein
MFKSSLKQYVLAAAACVAGAGAVWIWKNAVSLFAAGSFGGYEAFLMPLGAIALAACLFALSAIFIEPFAVLCAVSVASVGAAAFLVPMTPPIMGTMAGAALLAVFAGYRMRSEYASSITFSTSKTLKAGLPVYFTALSLVVTLFYYHEIIVRNDTAEDVIPRAAVDLSLRALSGAISDLRGLPQADSLMTVDEFIAQTLENQAKEHGVPAAAINKKEVARLVAEQRNELAQRYGIRVQGGERLTDVLHRTITAKVEELLGPYTRFLPFLSALAFFFALRTLSFPLYFLVVVLTYALICVLRAATIVKSEKRSIETERLVL